MDKVAFYSILRLLRSLEQECKNIEEREKIQLIKNLLIYEKQKLDFKEVNAALKSNGY